LGCLVCLRIHMGLTLGFGRSFCTVPRTFVLPIYLVVLLKICYRLTVDGDPFIKCFCFLY
jgi:hypothetical protein